ncbi:MAG: ATP-binding cassette domain-containing protein [Puniceicoccales bacterium]|jgi:ABC-type multidrug transport system ATPase subunit|nr:ATP-binding cassette domain-containing protein [Puniceicoccales bacterium]
MPKQACIDIGNLTKSFSAGKTVAIENLSMAIEKGQIIGLIGADGAGKTTLLRLMTGLLLPDFGKLCVCGLDPTADKEALNCKIGYMPQRFGLYEDLSVIDNMKLYADLKNADRNFDSMLDFADLKRFKSRLAGKLSGGMKQKLGLICALMGNPELILLDEPSVGVDPISRRELLKMVKGVVDENRTVIWSTAYMDEAHGFDTVIVIDKGRSIYRGNPYDLASNAAELEGKIIELMGGYVQISSPVAENFRAKRTNVTYAVEALGLAKRYGDFHAVRDNTFRIKKGEIFGLLGPNGAGKSTSFRMMCGLIKPSGGTAKIMGIDVVEKPSLARSNLGYMAQKFSLYPNLSVRQNLEFFAGAYGLIGKDFADAIGRMTRVFALEKYLNSNSEELPLGYRQRLSFACALIHNPSVLFLDEPTSGVDVIARREFWNHITSLAKKDVTVLITTHFMDEAEFCDRISLFSKGQTIATGTPAELKKKAGAKTMENAFINLISKGEEETP